MERRGHIQEGRKGKQGQDIKGPVGSSMGGRDTTGVKKEKKQTLMPRMQGMGNLYIWL